MRRATLALTLVAALAGCLREQPRSVGLGFGSDRASPVVLTELAVNGRPVMAAVPQVVDGWSDETMPRAQAGATSIALAEGQGDRIRLDMTWVELPTGRGWHLATNVPVAELSRASSDEPMAGLVFGPNGRVTVTSDPIPDAAGNQPRRNVMTQCATRSPDADTDYRNAPDSLPGLRDTLAQKRPAPVAPPTCPPPQR